MQFYWWQMVCQQDPLERPSSGGTWDQFYWWQMGNSIWMGRCDWSIQIMHIERGIWGTRGTVSACVLPTGSMMAWSLSTNQIHPSIWTGRCDWSIQIMHIVVTLFVWGTGGDMSLSMCLISKSDSFCNVGLAGWCMDIGHFFIFLVFFFCKGLAGWCMDIGHFFIFYSFSCEGLESYLHGPR